MTPLDILGGAGFLLFFFASLLLAVIVLARLDAWMRARRATRTARRPETACADKRRTTVLGCTRFSVIDTTRPRREIGRRR